MRFFRLPILILSAVLAGPAAAQDAPATTGPSAAPPSPPPSAPMSVESPQATQDKLLADLKRERDPDKAKQLAQQILVNWSSSGSATVDLLMEWANKSINDKKNAAALDFLDRVTLLQPDYPEVFNRRATLYYTMGDTRKSMADVQRVLALEPRYFPAIAGLASILTESGQDELALKAWERFLAIYPAERTAQENMLKLSEKLAGSRT
jgi:tetratricopeptide (TPR) repeat protein